MQKQPSAKRLEYRYYNLPVDFPVIALLRGVFRFPPLMFDGSQFMHLHNCIEIGYCYTGEGTLRVENKYIAYSAEDFFVIPPFASHITYREPERVKAGPSDVEYLYLDPEKLLGYLPEGRREFLAYFKHDSPEFPYVLHGKEHPHIARLLLGILDAMRECGEHYKGEVAGLTQALMIRLARLLPESVRRGESTPVRETVMSLTPCMTYLDENYMEHISPQDLAEKCHMSPTHFRRVFKSTVGLTPLEYIHLVRIYKAKELLYSSELSVLEISLAVGYESLSSFNRRFSASVGLTPNKWRNKTRAIRRKEMQFSQFQWLDSPADEAGDFGPEELL